MNRYVALLLLSLTMVFIGCCQNADLRVPVVDRDKSQTAALVEEMDGNSGIICSAVWVNSDTMITARHCVQGARQTRFLASLPTPQDRMLVVMLGLVPTFTDEELLDTTMFYFVEDEYPMDGHATAKHNASVIASDKQKDLAILKAVGEVPRHVSAPIIQKVPETGATVSIVGHTRGLGWNYIPGTISRVRMIEKEGDDDETSTGTYVHIIALIAQGNSGGGAFDSHGCLVGIASFMGSPGQAFFVHPQTILEFLSSKGVKFTTHR